MGGERWWMMAEDDEVYECEEREQKCGRGCYKDVRNTSEYFGLILRIMMKTIGHVIS